METQGGPEPRFETMIEAVGLTKVFDRFAAIRDVSFAVPASQVAAFLGPNGAGKSTTMRILTGYLSPSRGVARIAGLDVAERRIETASRVGYLPENGPLYPEMTPLSLLRFLGTARGLPNPRLRQRVDAVVSQCALTQVLEKPIRKLSKGYRQRVGMAQALLHDPEVLILDEPTSGLDPNQIVEIRTLIHNLGKEKTVVLSTHILPEVTATCTRVVIINRGKIAADAPIGDLQRGLRGGDRIALELRVPESETPQTVAAVLRNVPKVESVVPVDDASGPMKFTVSAPRSHDVRADIFRLCVEKGWVALDLHREETSLEDIFRELTMQA
jgi:ABC-2 type transport system ATP-binding protein